MIEIAIYIIVLAVAGISIFISLLIGSSAIAIFFTRVPFVPTPQRNIKIIIDQFGLKPQQKFYDLGCGDGRSLIEDQRRGAKATDFEISPWAYARAKHNIALHKSKAVVIYKNFYHKNMADADAIFCFLIDTVMPKVEKNLRLNSNQGLK